MSYHPSSLELALAGAITSIVFGLLSPFLLVWTATVLIVEGFVSIADFFGSAAVER